MRLKFEDGESQELKNKRRYITWKSSVKLMRNYHTESKRILESLNQLLEKQR